MKSRAIEHGRIGTTTFGVTQNDAHYLMSGVLADIHRDRRRLSLTVACDGFLNVVTKLKLEEPGFVFRLIGRLHHSDGLLIEPLTETGPASSSAGTLRLPTKARYQSPIWRRCVGR